MIRFRLDEISKRHSTRKRFVLKQKREVNRSFAMPRVLPRNANIQFIE